MVLVLPQPLHSRESRRKKQNEKEKSDSSSFIGRSSTSFDRRDQRICTSDFGLQNIDDSLYEAAKIDGASLFAIFRKITIPLLRPTILLTTIMSINGTLQLFDESVNLTGGGPANSTLTMSHYIYKASFEYNPQFGYAAAMSYVIFIMVAILSFVQMKVGDKR